MAKLTGAGGVWWYSVLATSVPRGAECRLDEIWPTPARNASFLVSAHRAGARCRNNTVPSACLRTWRAGQALTTAGLVPLGDDRKWLLFAAAPVLSGGFALLGEPAKYVRVSPQRFLVGSPPPRAPAQAGLSSSSALDEASVVVPKVAGSGPTVLSFRVLGAAAEVIAVQVVVPQAGCQGTALACALAGRVQELEVAMPPAGAGVGIVRCEPSGCSVTVTAAPTRQPVIKTDDEWWTCSGFSSHGGQVIQTPRKATPSVTLHTKGCTS
jgi:hypothetical protein